MFGDKAEIKARMSTLLQELRDSPKADGVDRIYTHGERAWASAERLKKEGIPVNVKTLDEMKTIAEKLGVQTADYLKDITDAPRL